eukprot:TRINITY_DN2472_c2_g2_i7.p1 TRINITY_DN2472_c2_g2~~TRINITY_DN2472_c2_g2_i7.p1  ORF type:complete len:109 (-),score=12.82 TRINITY_DN2472_c2_g2_i7:361-687(-)
MPIALVPHPFEVIAQEVLRSSGRSIASTPSLASSLKPFFFFFKQYELHPEKNANRFKKKILENDIQDTDSYGKKNVLLIKPFWLSFNQVFFSQKSFVGVKRFCLLLLL